MAEFDIAIGGRAKLVTAGTDPLGVGKDYVGQTFPIAEWQKFAPLSKACWKCDRCSAQLFELGDSRLALDCVEGDPHGLAEKLLGKTYFRTVWAKVANGLSAKVGNTNCPACEASFDYDQVDKRLKLLECDRGRFARAIPLLGKLLDLGAWSLFAAGKDSLEPGWLCSRCRAEFDENGIEMRLVGGPPNVQSRLGQSRSFADWHRLARGLPSDAEEADLRRELARLESERRELLARLRREEQERKAVVERQLRERKVAIGKQIEDLLKQSFIGGFIPLRLQTTSLSLKKDEHLLWETAACKLKQRSSNGIPFWGTDAAGALLVTDRRVIFRASTGAIWTKSIDRLLSVNHEYAGSEGVCVLWIDGQQKPVGFAGIRTTMTISMGNNVFPIETTSHDLRELLQSRCGG
jgi:hypothetical protein